MMWLQELYDSLEKRRPNLFRLASDTDEQENEAMSEWTLGPLNARATELCTLKSRPTELWAHWTLYTERYTH